MSQSLGTGPEASMQTSLRFHDIMQEDAFAAIVDRLMRIFDVDACAAKTFNRFITRDYPPFLLEPQRDRRNMVVNEK